MQGPSYLVQRQCLKFNGLIPSSPLKIINYKAITKVLFLGILGLMSYKGLILNATDIFKLFPQSYYNTFSNQQTYAFRFKGAFQLFDKTLCKTVQCFN